MVKVPTCPPKSCGSFLKCWELPVTTADVLASTRYASSRDQRTSTKHEDEMLRRADWQLPTCFHLQSQTVNKEPFQMRTNTSQATWRHSPTPLRASQMFFGGVTKLRPYRQLRFKSQNNRPCRQKHMFVGDAFLHSLRGRTERPNLMFIGPCIIFIVA